jgi:hypothetical protein
MSRKPSTAALISFGHESFPTRRRAPRHPAGEKVSTTNDYAAEIALLFRRPGLQPRRKAPKTKWALAPEDTLSPLFSSGHGFTCSGVLNQSATQTALVGLFQGEIAQVLRDRK